jgi:hypothetical protein
MAASRALIASTAFLLAMPAGLTAAQGEPAAHVARTPASIAETAAAQMRRFPPDCAIAVEGGRDSSRWFLPRANLVVENRSPHRFTLRMEARPGIAAPDTDLGTLESGEIRTFRHVVPAGRSAVLARRQDTRATLMRQPIYIWNHGPFTCQRRFVWVLR